MTETQQRGYDDQAAGMLNAALAEADTPAGREYRDGARARRRDAEEGLTQEQRAAAERDRDAKNVIAANEGKPLSAPFEHPVGCSCHQCNFGGGEPAAVMPDAASMGAAFAEPEPAGKKPKKPKQAADDGQASLF